jgi:serine phosphatase RsbU (regulator of sigma subunit)
MAIHDDPPIEELSSEELLARLRGLTRLLDVTRSVAQEVDLDALLETIAREACRALDCDRASLYQYDPARKELFTRVATELEIEEIRHAVDRGVTGDVARSRRIANIPQASADPRWSAAVDRRTGYTTRNILAAPVVSPQGDELLGVLQVLNKREGAFDQFDEDLIAAFSRHVAVALDRARLVDELRKREAMQASLKLARSVQRGFMPHDMPQVPGYELAFWWFPNEAVGGDYCDVIPLRDGRLGLAIADVSGHGLGPSLIMASVRAALRALLLRESSPEVLLRMLNQAIFADLQDSRFVTMVLGLLDCTRHELVFSNAGHAPALLYRGREDEFITLSATGMPLGVLDDQEFPRGESLSLSPGDVLLLCTDGIVEATDAEGKFFGEPRLRAMIREGRGLTAQNLVQGIGRAVSSYIVGDVPPDDLTVLAVKRVA